MRTAALALRSVPRAALSLPPAWRRRGLALLAMLLVLAAGYWFWFRDSSFAKVNEVYVTGTAGPQARAIRSALEDAGLSQTTLHVSQSELQQAVSGYPVVRSITARGEFPHKLLIQVDLNLPVGVLQTPTGRVPVAADGLLLRDVPITSTLPTLTSKVALPADRVTAGPNFTLVRVVSAAPEPLRGRIKSAAFRPGVGLVLTMVRGPELRFGDASRVPAKWIAAARVLAAPAAQGATYIDLRLPGRPAAGGLSTTALIPLAPAGDVAANTQPQVQTSSQVSTTP